MKSNRFPSIIPLRQSGQGVGSRNLLFLLVLPGEFELKTSYSGQIFLENYGKDKHFVFWKSISRKLPTSWLCDLFLHKEFRKRMIKPLKTQRKWQILIMWTILPLLDASWPCLAERTYEISFSGKIVLEFERNSNISGEVARMSKHPANVQFCSKVQ